MKWSSPIKTENKLPAVGFLRWPGWMLFLVTPFVVRDIPSFKLLFKVLVHETWLPSLHVAFAFTLALVLGENLGTYGQLGLTVWAFSVLLSTLFTHQHHMVRALSGGLLFYVIIWIQGKRLLQL